MLSAFSHLAPLLLMSVVPVHAPATTQLAMGEAGWATADEGPFDAILEGYREDVSNQVRIEQHLHIRIAPRPGPMPMELELDETRTISNPHYVVTKVGKCIAANNFSSVGPGAGRRLFLFTRDNRIFSALLEKGCQGRDYYSGFYLAGSADAKLCVDRDRLISRAGANCRLKQIRELVEVGD
jgi:hypothetical protein